MPAMPTISYCVRFLAIVLVGAFCVSMIDDDLFLQSTTKATNGLSTYQSTNGSGWAQELSTWTTWNSSRSWQTWIQSNTSSFYETIHTETQVNNSPQVSMFTIANNMQHSGENSDGLVGSSTDKSRKATSIVIQLTGEMGNQLCRIAYGYGLKWILEDDYHITTRVILRHQEHPNWVRAWNSVKTCFPNLRDMDFSEGNTDEFEERLKQQHMWLGAHIVRLSDCERETCIREQLDRFVHILNNATNPQPEIPLNANITLPFLYAETYSQLDYINDRFYDRFKGDLFQFDLDNPECCDPKAQLDETVFHARGYATEMPMSANRYGFQEVSPNKTVNELLQNHRPGDKVAVLSRFAPFGQRYVDQMVSAGLDARLVETRNGELSFCFLMSARKELIGCSQSTFAVWASYLGNASKSRLYSIRTPERISMLGDRVYAKYNFTNPSLRKKFSFELYNSEAQDQIDGNQRQLLLRSRVTRSTPIKSENDIRV